MAFNIIKKTLAGLFYLRFVTKLHDLCNYS